MKSSRCLTGATLFASKVLSSSATNFLPHATLLADVEDPAWFERNVPILDVPDQQIQDVYYYRWQTWREHLFYTGPQYGFLETEFLLAVGYGGPFGGIVAAAGHHINEGRWLRDKSIGQDLINFWLAGPGQFHKNATDDLNPDTHDWAHEYSFWAASSVWRQYLATGDREFAVGHLDNMVKQYRGWDNHFNQSLGLYWQAPVWDATEYTSASYQSSDPYHGGYGYRPTINSYQYGDARAISAIASMAGDTALAKEYSDRAASLQTALEDVLWDTKDKFFKHRARDNNPTGALLNDREIMGYIPWMFNMPTSGRYSVAFAELKDPKGFSSPYGPTTLENRSSLFMKDAATGCCHWDGPSWPFATAQTLTACENLLNDYHSTEYLSAADYFTLFSRYAATQYKNGQPYVAEAHNAYQDVWQYDTPGHSEDYAHSTYVDNVISGLIGLRAQSGHSLVINPLAPSTWAYFGLENTAYHGHNVTVIWDKSGSRYGKGKGMMVFIDGKLAGSRPDLGSLSVQVGATIPQIESTLVNIAANGLKLSQGTQPNASFTSSYGGDDVWHAIDGEIFRLGIPENSRWTTYQSPNPTDWLSIDLRRPQAISDIRLYFYDDGGGVQVPSSYDVQYLKADKWTTISDQQRVGTLANNAEIRITFPQVVTSQLRVVAPNRSGGTGWGLSELQIWTDPIFQIRNVNSDKLMGVVPGSLANSAGVLQSVDNDSSGNLWKFIQSPGGYFKIMNVASGKLLDVHGGSKANSAPLQQSSDSGSPAVLWRVEDTGDDQPNGKFLIRNKNSGLVAGVAGESKDTNATIVQFADNGTADHLWELLPAVPPS